MRYYLVILLVLSLSISPLLAQVADQSTGRIVVHHNDGTIDIQNGTAEIVSRDQLRTGLSYRVRPRESVDVIIDDPNPLLYTYEWKLGALRNSDNYDAARKFADAINPVLGILKGLTGVPVDPGAERGGFVAGPGCGELSNDEAVAVCGSGIDNDFIKEYAQHYDALLEFSRNIPNWIKRSAGSKQNGEIVKAEVLGHRAARNSTDIAAAIRQIKTARNARVSAISKRKASLFSAQPVQIASLAPMIDLFYLDPQSSVGSGTLPTPAAEKKDEKKDDTKPKSQTKTPTKKSTTKSPLATENEQLKKRVAQLEAAATKAAAKEQLEKEAREKRLNAEIALLKDFDQLSATVNDAEDTLKAVNEFVTLVKKINDPLHLGTLPYNAKQVQPATLIIKTVPANASAVDSDVKTGEFAFSFEAFNPVDYTVDAGPVYSFIEAPEFGTEEVGGKHRIVRTDDGDEVNGATIGAMLTLVPRRWNDPTFGGGFQIGVSPESNKLGFYLGAVIRMFDLVSFGGGLVYQQTQRLGPGQTVGRDLDAADDLDTNTVFKAGPYISLSIKLK